MKKVFLFISMFSSWMGFSQFENSDNSVRFDASDSNINSSSGFEMPAINKPTLTNISNTNNNNSTLGREEEKDIDMKNGDGLIEYNSTKTPKYFTKDKEAKPEYGKDQYLGDLSTTKGQVTFMYRDHQYVDGDRIRIYVNGDIVEPNVMLEGSFKGFNLPLQSGFNKVEFQALNQGSSGPNTAQLEIRDDDGTVLASYEWNLLTGNKATAIIVKK